MTDTVVVNGALTEGGTVPADDRGFLLGDGLFETILFHRGRPLWLNRHLARMEAGAALLGVRLPFLPPEVEQAIYRLARRGKLDDGVARLTVSRGSGPRGYSPAGCVNPTWVMTLRRHVPPPARWYDEGIALAPVPYRRDERSPVAGVKSTSALERVMAIDHARGRGGDEGIVTDTAGRIACCVAANLFWVAGGELFTPSVDCGIVAGIARSVILEAARNEKIVARQVAEPPTALVDADEVFVTNALMGPVPVRVAGEWFAAKTVGPGETTRRLTARYRAARDEA
jgi:aminodeoxychorismate lyase